MTAPRVLHASAYLDEDGSWTIKIPELSSPAPSGAIIVATGSATSVDEVDQAAHELAAVWLDLEIADVDVRVKRLETS